MFYQPPFVILKERPANKLFLASGGSRVASLDFSNPNSRNLDL